MKPEERKIESLEDLEQFAVEIASNIELPLTIGLAGELGAGKTTLAKFIVKALGINHRVTSPTYVLQNIYNGNGITVEHWDLYRVSTLPLELDQPPSSSTLRLIEWPPTEVDMLITLTLNQDHRLLTSSRPTF